MRVDTTIMVIACCSVKLNTLRSLPGSLQPSWICVVPTSSPRMANCHSLNLSSGTHSGYKTEGRQLESQTSTFIEYDTSNHSTIRLLFQGMLHITKRQKWVMVCGENIGRPIEQLMGALIQI